MSSLPDLSIVIPVYNAAAHLEELTVSLLAIPDVSVELIYVDDCSSDDSAEILQRLSAQHPSVRALFHATNLGAGVARNTGFALVRGTYTLFFDADDRIHGDVIAPALAAMTQSTADLAMFSYRYQREKDASHESMNLHDEEIWRAYIGKSAMVSGTLGDFPRLLGFSNYPWNKILRTATYKACGLQYGKTKVNNDILGHWYSLMFANRILLVNSVICTHIVHSTGGNLTNQHSRVRLQLFEALNDTYDLLRAHPMMRQRYAHHFWSLVMRTSGWARARISPDMANEFKYNLQELVSRIDLGDFGLMRLKRNKALARSLANVILS